MGKCDACGQTEGLEKVDIAMSDDPRPVLSVTLCGPDRRGLDMWVQRVQRAILARIR